MSSGCTTGTLVSLPWCVLFEGNTMYSHHFSMPNAFMTTHFLLLNSFSQPVRWKLKEQYYQYSHQTHKPLADYAYLNSVTVPTRRFTLSTTPEPRVVTIRHSFPAQQGTPILPI